MSTDSAEFDIDFDLEELTADDFSVEEFYNAFHGKDGRFTFKKGGKRGKIHVPMSEAARRSNAIMRSMAATRRSKDYKTAAKNIKGDWANREKGQGGLRGVKGANSKKADTARAANAAKSAKLRTVGNDNKDGSTPLKGAFKTTGNKRNDMMDIMKLDRGSPERKAAAKAFEKAYAKS